MLENACTLSTFFASPEETKFNKNPRSFLHRLDCAQLVLNLQLYIVLCRIIRGFTFLMFDGVWRWRRPSRGTIYIKCFFGLTIKTLLNLFLQIVEKVDSEWWKKEMRNRVHYMSFGRSRGSDTFGLWKWYKLIQTNVGTSGLATYSNKGILLQIKTLVWWELHRLRWDFARA